MVDCHNPSMVAITTNTCIIVPIMLIQSNLDVLSQKLLRELFEYRDGELYWKVSPSEKIKSGSVVGTIGPHGYKVTKVNYKGYRVHRLIFMYHHGYMPEFVDHIDCDKLNNRIENLRSVTQSQNQLNRKIFKCSKSGVKGVYWHKGKKKWTSGCSNSGQWYNLGTYDTREEAEKSVRDFREEHHGEFVNHG